MLIFSLAGQLLFLAGAMFLSARWVVKSKGFYEGIIKGTLLLYGLTVICFFLFSVVIPSLFIRVGADKGGVINSFPEAICNVPVILFSWGAALIFAILVRGIFDVIKVRRVDSASKP